ncbi:hypothetical protein L9F63_016979, partial [Diploptera punctata]
MLVSYPQVLITEVDHCSPSIEVECGQHIGSPVVISLKSLKPLLIKMSSPNSAGKQIDLFRSMTHS